MTPIVDPALSVVMPTFNNEAILRRAVESWRAPASVNAVELIVVEDGCKDGTSAFLDAEARTAWGARHLPPAHGRCARAAMYECRLRVARAPLLAAWQDDMFVRGAGSCPSCCGCSAITRTSGF